MDRKDWGMRAKIRQLGIAQVDTLSGMDELVWWSCFHAILLYDFNCMVSFQQTTLFWSAEWGLKQWQKAPVSHQKVVLPFCPPRNPAINWQRWNCAIAGVTWTRHHFFSEINSRSTPFQWSPDENQSSVHLTQLLHQFNGSDDLTAVLHQHLLMWSNCTSKIKLRQMGKSQEHPGNSLRASRIKLANEQGGRDNWH